MVSEVQLRRIGIIGDIHAEDRLLQTALEFLAMRDLDLIMAVGDIADGVGSVDRCYQLLHQYSVAAVTGNHERWFLSGQARDLPEATSADDVSSQARSFLSELPKTRDYETVAGRLLLCHGLGEYDMGGVWPADNGYALESNLALLRLVKENLYKFVVNGHTHQRMVRRFDQLTIINAGTLLHGHQPCFLIADFERGFVQYYDLKPRGQLEESGRVKLPADE